MRTTNNANTSRSNLKDTALSGTQQSTVQALEKGEDMFERCTLRCCYCVNSELSSPQWLNDKLIETNFARLRNVACDL